MIGMLSDLKDGQGCSEIKETGQTGTEDSVNDFVTCQQTVSFEKKAVCH